MASRERQRKTGRFRIGAETLLVGHEFPRNRASGFDPTAFAVGESGGEALLGLFSGLWLSTPTSVKAGRTLRHSIF